MAWDEGLQDPHLAIAASADTSVWVLAGPGTGKTFALMRKVERLLEEGVASNRVLAVTFTRTAAKDLRDQLQSLGVPGADQVVATTLHALCFAALAREEAFEQTQRTARPLLSYEIDALEADLAGGFGGKRAVQAQLQAYEAAWARLQQDEPGWAPTAQDAAFEAALLDWLRYHRAMLIGELVPLALRHLRSNPAVPLFTQFDHVLADEFQDLNKSDQALVKELATHGSSTVIGDDNQSIYSFRHANPQGIRDYPAANPGTATFVIDTCRRCPPNIVEMSNALIAHDADSLRQPPLVPDPGRTPATVYVVQHTTPADELAAVADFVRTYLHSHPDTRPGQVLVLSPRRFIGQAVKRSLIDQGLQSLSYFYEDELNSVPAAEGFCLLTLLVRPNDRAALRGWFALGSSSRLVASYERLRAYCSATAAEPRDVLDKVRTGALRLPHTGPLLARYDVLLSRLGALHGLGPAALVDALWPPDVDAVQDLRRLAQTIALEAENPGELLGFLHEEITQPELPSADDDIIRVMSLHKSKGFDSQGSCGGRMRGGGVANH